MKVRKRVARWLLLMVIAAVVLPLLAVQGAICWVLMRVVRLQHRRADIWATRISLSCFFFLVGLVTGGLLTGPRGYPERSALVYAILIPILMFGFASCRAERQMEAIEGVESKDMSSGLYSLSGCSINPKNDFLTKRVIN